ncbi:MAG: FkbM family methyltransferase [Nonlabens sp.]|uniref:FkbM family methyltransferase n=2 Tax=Nonlabens sp. TaxID=1888209 RepID=UPI003219BD62
MIKGKLPAEFIQYVRRKKRTDVDKDALSQIKDLINTPRFTEKKVTFHGKEIVIPDAASFLFMQDEIFKKEIYKFSTLSKSPYIIDGGANIGLSSIYFKQLFPDAEIIAFEPDPHIYNILSVNLSNMGYQDVLCLNQGLWNEETTLSFYSEGADGGTMKPRGINKEYLITVKASSLVPYLNRKVDFLKLDIEGAELIVLNDIKGNLHNVERIFVEYHSYINENQSLSELISILESSGFRIYINSPGLTSLQPFHKINTYNNMDMQLNIYGIRFDLNND